MRISKILEWLVRFSLLYSSFFDAGSISRLPRFDPPKHLTYTQSHTHTYTHTYTYTPRSRAIADAWSLNNLLLFDRTLLAKLNGQTICSSSVKVPTSDYPSTDAHLFRLVFFSAAKWNSLSCERYQWKEERRREKDSKRWLLKMGMDE